MLMEADPKNMLNETTCTALPGAIWRPYAWKQSSCEVPGHAFSKDSKGTMACCRKYRKGGGKYECFEWSQADSTKESCEACNGQWMSIFTWQKYGSWLEGTWGKAYTWKQRSLDKQNFWITQLDRWKMDQIWENVVMSVRARPMSNFLRCRIGPTLGTLVSMSQGKFPKPELAVTKVLPGQATRQEVGGGVSIATDSKTNTGSKSISMELSLDSAANQLADGNKSESGGRRLLTKNDRRLAASLSIDALAASCYAVVKVDTKAVGQLVGDCVGFKPSAALTGSAELCLSINSKFAVNPLFTVWGVAANANGVYTTQTTVPVKKGESICAKVQLAGTYCPIKYNKAYTPGQALPSGFTGADASCGQMDAAKKTIATQAKVLVDSGFTGSGNLVKVGQVTSAPSEAAVDTQGGLLGAEGTVSNVQSFVDTATKAATFTTTTTVVTKAPSLFGGDSKTTTGTTGTTGGSTTGANAPVLPQTASYAGSVSLSVTGATKTQMETSMKKTLAQQFAVSDTGVAVTATESRRLADASPRQLAGTWTIVFVITVPGTQMAAIEAKASALTADTTSLKTELATQLKAAGVSDDAIKSLSVASFSAVKKGTAGPSASGANTVKSRAAMLAMMLAGLLALLR